MMSDKFVAHRGWQQYYPENTLAAIEAAINSGAKHIEIDIQLTRDLVPILCHDAPLERLSNSPLNINEISHLKLTALSSYEPERFGNTFIGTPFMALSECVTLIKQHRDLTFYVELKRQSINIFGITAFLAAVLPILEPVKNQIILISFNSDILLDAKKQGWNKVAPVLSNWEQAFSSGISQLSAPLLFCNKKHLTVQQTIDQLPAPCVFYEIGDYQEALDLLDQGAHMIESFNVGDFLAIDRQQDQT